MSDNAQPQPNFFVLIPSHMLDDPRIDDSTAILFGRIASLSNNKGYCWASDQYLADLTGVKLRELQYRLKTLEDCGYMKRDSKKIGMKWDRMLYPNFNYETHICAPRNAHMCGIETHICAEEQDNCLTVKAAVKHKGAAAASFEDIDPEAQRRFEPSPDSNPFKPDHKMSPKARAELQKVGLSETEIDNMAIHNPKITDEQWIRTAHHSLKRKGDKNPGWYVRCAQEEWYNEEPTETVKDANRDRLRAKYHSLDSKDLCNHRITVGSDYIAFSCGQIYKSFTLSEKDAEAKLDKWLEKRNIKNEFYKELNEG